MLHRLLDI
jgi:hypothetical protein